MSHFNVQCLKKYFIKENNLFSSYKYYYYHGEHKKGKKYTNGNILVLSYKSP